ncbi:capsular biosynthesis protein CpsI [Methyloceanibacter superfactus]|uniref:Capsular biosynthesis protein CpsI n=1 Tax=Methyloceanibacter superfactus TaxID=1774969 RepID=A0A1E3VV43_9HYPH|nr:NAD-dependent epimerase [Methyloceanibacter superfactus]ODR97420.1 capsular biosynthesis protein CpsI [Methyloceanibacter superfactus]
MKILVTGAAGFIGFHTAQALLDRGDEVVGLDNMNAYYDVTLKEARLTRLAPRDHFSFVKGDIADQETVAKLFAEHQPQRVIHLAAQAGVRHSLTHPGEYAQSNLVGFLNILEACRHQKVEHLVYASSSSVYGGNTHTPYSVHNNVDHPLSFYGATKKSNELMAHSYAHLYQLPVTGLRFFTVYGPWGRPDMALFKFVHNILADEPIDIYNEGRHARDFTYIDDIVEGVLRTGDRIAAPNLDWSGEHPDPGTSSAPYRLYNIGNNSPVPLMDFIGYVETALGRKAKKKFLPLQPGDVPATYADITSLKANIDFEPGTPIDEGIRRFVAWYRDFYKV